MAPNKHELKTLKYAVFAAFSIIRRHSRRYGLPASHGENRGSSPLGSANDFQHLAMDKQLDDSACLFLFDFLGGAVAWPLATQPQQQERMRRIGVLGLARGRRLEVDDQLVLGRPCTGRSAGFSPLRMRSTFTDAEIVEPAPGKPNEDLRPRKLTAVEMTLALGRANDQHHARPALPVQ